MTNLQDFAIRVVSRIEYPVLFRYLGEAFAVDGIDFGFPEAALRSGRIVGKTATFYRQLLEGDEQPGQFIRCPDDTYAVSGVANGQRFAIIQAHKSLAQPGNKTAIKRRILARCKDPRYLRLAQEQAAMVVFQEVVVHGLPNVNKNIIASCEASIANFSQRDLDTIRNSAAQIRLISNAHRILSPSWHPGRSGPPIAIYKQVERQRAILSNTLASRHLSLDIEGNRDRLKIHPEDIQTLLFSLFDNAAKYMEPNTSGHIGFSSRDGAYQISIVMKSVVIERAEVDNIQRYGVRSKRAIGYTTKGNGIGLVLVKRIAEGYGGSLLIEPGNRSNPQDTFARNRFTVRFPTSMLV